MDPVPKRLIREQNLDDDGNNGGEDLIGNLPDCVLAHILSKLPTKFAVGSAILSTKWKHLFSLIPEPDINLDDSLIIHSQTNSDSDSERRMRSFVDFNNRVFDNLLKEVRSIRKFTLNCTESCDNCEHYDEEDVLDWIYGALDRYVVILDISAPLLDLVESLLELISGSPTLFCLIFRQISICNPPSHPPFHVPNLKYILFYEVTLLDDEAIPMILSGCPMLRNFTMRDCSLCYIDVVNVSSPSLKYLSIEACFYDPYSDTSQSFLLNAPALEQFYFKDSVMNTFEFENLNSVLTADILFLPSQKFDDEDSLPYHPRSSEFVGGFSSVQVLYLSKDTISDLQKSGKQIPIFSDLLELHLGGFDTNGWKLLPCLLEKAPNLELFCILEKFYEEKGSYGMFLSHRADTFPACLVSTVERIEIFGFQGEVDEICLIRVGKGVLKKLDITCDMSSQKVQISKLCLESRPELTETCELIFHNE